MVMRLWLPTIWIYSNRQSDIKTIWPDRSERLGNELAVAKRYRSSDDSYPRLLIRGWHHLFKNGDVMVAGLTTWRVESPNAQITPLPLTERVERKEKYEIKEKD